MATEDKSYSPERERTDESLRTERDKTDRALADRRVAEENADEVVSRARESADAVVSEARQRADREEDEAGTSTRRGALVEARALEDEAIQDERDSADETLRREREESSRALRTLLPLEREKTDRHLLTERARSDDAVASRDDFLGIASHDLRTLLGGIVMSAGTISRRVPSTDEGKKILVETERIQRYTARMHRLIGDLVDVARINAGKLAVKPEQNNAAKLISEAVDMFKAAASEKGVSLTAEMIQRHLPLQFDYERMLQLMCNLISNAIKFSYQGGRIRVRGEMVEDELRLSVSDTGRGIPAHMLEGVFERFWQADQNDQRGLGLGLYISKCIVEAHGGRIWAESKIGEGSTFFIRLPAPVDRD